MVRHEVAMRDANEKGQILVSWCRKKVVHLYKALIGKYLSQDVFFKLEYKFKEQFSVELLGTD